mgnify:FL=1
MFLKKDKVFTWGVQGWIGVLLLLAAGFFPDRTYAQSGDEGKFIVVLDPGNGGKAAGTTGTGRYRQTTEKHIVLNVALEVRKLLESKASDIRVVMTRTRDTDVGLNQRSVIANKAKAHLFVSIHCNSLANVKRDGPKIWGAETYVMSLNKLDDNREIAQKENADILLEENYKEVYKGFDPSDPRATISIDLEQAKHLTGSIEMAKMVQKHLASTAGRKDKGVKQAGFWVICYNTMPSVLTEIGYLSNATEEAFLHSEKGQKQIAQALCDAILEYKARFYDATGGNTSSASSIESVMSSVLSDTSEGQDRDAASAVQYCVQLTASPKALDVRTNVLLKKFRGVEYFRENGMYKYTTARVARYAQAVEALADAREKGAKDAFIVAFRGDEKIDVARARSLSGE